MQQACVNRLGRGKPCFRSKREADKVSRRAPIKLWTYCCPICGLWHCTHEKPRHKVEAVPSAAKLRRQLANINAHIASQQRKLEQSEARLAEERERAAAITRNSERVHAEEV